VYYGYKRNTNIDGYIKSTSEREITSEGPKIPSGVAREKYWWSEQRRLPQLYFKIAQFVHTINIIKEEKAFMIFSGFLGQKLFLLYIINHRSVWFVFFAKTRLNTNNGQKNGLKYRVFSRISPRSVKHSNRPPKIVINNSVSISFSKSTDGVSKENIDSLDSSFMYTQILKDILLTINFKQITLMNS
jgi:hypothetical protein